MNLKEIVAKYLTDNLEQVQLSRDNETLKFVPHGMKNASLRLRFVALGLDDELILFLWQIDNHSYKDRAGYITRRDDRAKSLDMVRVQVLKSMSEYKVMCLADAQRSATARISYLQSQADHWLQGLIDAAGAEKSSGGTEAVET